MELYPSLSPLVCRSFGHPFPCSISFSKNLKFYPPSFSLKISHFAPSFSLVFLCECFQSAPLNCFALCMHRSYLSPARIKVKIVSFISFRFFFIELSFLCFEKKRDQILSLNITVFSSFLSIFDLEKIGFWCCQFRFCCLNLAIWADSSCSGYWYLDIDQCIKVWFFPCYIFQVFNFFLYHQLLLHSGIISELFQSSNFGDSKL